MHKKFITALLLVLIFALPRTAIGDDSAGHTPIHVASSMIQPVTLSDDILEKLAALIGITSGEIHSLTDADISGAKALTQSMKDQMRNDGYESLCTLGTITVEESGCYVMAVKFPEQLAGMSIARVRLYALNVADFQAGAVSASDYGPSDGRITDESGNETDELAESMLIIMMLESGNPVCMVLAGALILTDSGGDTDACGGSDIGGGGLVAAVIWAAVTAMKQY